MGLLVKTFNMKNQKDVTYRLQNLENKLQKDKLDVAEQIGMIKRLALCSQQGLEERLDSCVKYKNYSEVREILWFLQ